MAESFDASINVDTGSAVSSLRELNEELGETSEAAESSGASFGELATGFNQTLEVAGKFKDAVVAVAQVVGEMSAELERQAGILNRFTGDIDEAARRTNNLTSNLDLMTASNRAAQAGLDLTAHEFANLAVAANEFAAATGGDATQAMDTLAQAIASGRTGPLRQLGIDLTGITGVVNMQAEALRQLEERYGDAESAADTFGGELGNLAVILDNAQTEIIAVVSVSDSATESFDKMTEAITDLMSHVNLFGEDEFLGPVEQFGVFVGAVISSVVDEFTRVINIISALNQVMNALRAGNETEAFQIAANASLAAAQGSESIASRFWDDLLELRSERADSDATRRKREKEDEAAGRTGGGAGRRRAGVSIDGDGGPTGVTGSVEEGMDTGELAFGVGAIAEAFRPDKGPFEDITKEIALGAEKAAELADKMQMASEAGMVFGSLMVDAITVTLEGQGNFIENLAAGTAEWSKKKAFEEGIEGAIEFAKGIGASIVNPVEAGTHFASAGKHFAIMGALGGAAVAAGAASGDGGSGGGSSRPESTGGSSSSNKGGGTVVINVNSPMAEPLIGRMQDKHSRVAKRRLGSGLT